MVGMNWICGIATLYLLVYCFKMAYEDVKFLDELGSLDLTKESKGV